MYGFVNSALEKLICRRFGREKWEEIRQKANIYLGERATFLVNTIYRDEDTYILVGAAAEVIGLDPATILEMFGEQFLVWCKESGYAKTLQLLGRSLQDFLTNLDALHDHLSIIYPQMDAPSFRCTGEGSQFYLHYYSNRDGLESIVKGIVKAVAREFYGVEVSMSVIKSKGNSEDHSCFLIKEIAYYSDLKHNNPANYVNSASSNQLISPESFCKCFPFHIIFGRNMNVLQVGSSLANLVSGWDESDKNLTTFFALERPRMKLTFANILAHINTIFILRMTMMLQQSNSSGDLANNQPMRLRGQMIYLPESDSVLFVCSPRVSSIYDLDQGGLYLSDIPLHDATRGLLMMSQTAQSEFHHVIQLEEVIGKLNIAQRSLEEEKGRMRDLLHQMLPISVADSLMAGQMVEAERFESVTILFSDIVGFTSICGSCEPIQIVSMLNKLYTMFDQVVGVNGVYKVETIGDAYMVVGGLPERNSTHAERVANQALDMMYYCQEVIRPDNNETIMMRIGIHSGAAVAGIVGRRMPRYCLFGNTVNIASRTESNGLEGKIQVTEYTHKLLVDKPNFEFSVRGPLQFKNVNEPIMCYILEANTEKVEYFPLDVPEEITYDFMQPKDTPPATPFVYSGNIPSFSTITADSPMKNPKFNFAPQVNVIGSTPIQSPSMSPLVPHKVPSCPFSNSTDQPAQRKISVESNTSQGTEPSTPSESDGSLISSDDITNSFGGGGSGLSNSGIPHVRIHQSQETNEVDTSYFVMSVKKTLSFDNNLGTMSTVLEDSQEELDELTSDNITRTESEPIMLKVEKKKRIIPHTRSMDLGMRSPSFTPEGSTSGDDESTTSDKSDVRYIRPRSTSIKDRVKFFDSTADKDRDRGRRTGLMTTGYFKDDDEMSLISNKQTININNDDKVDS